MKKQKCMNNKGYSMVEMMIVIAIIGILTAASLITLRAVDNSKYRKAVTTLESEMTTLRTTTIAQDSRMAMLLYYDASDGCYYIKRGLWGDPDGNGTNAFHEVEDLPDSDVLKNSTYYDYAGTSSPVKVLKNGSISYTLFYEADVNEQGVVLAYNKSDGSFYMPGQIMQELDENGNVVTPKTVTFSLYRKNGELITNVVVQVPTGIFYETY
ncbi:MAG: type II secretion system protein [Lachnospiraceae bacterium]|nr:type II secretion system protein [Lachnospiraceae bacterium]